MSLQSIQEARGGKKQEDPKKRRKEKIRVS